MRKTLILLSILLLYSCATTVSVVRRYPEFRNSLPTNPRSIFIYDEGRLPSWDYFIIAELEIDVTWEISSRRFYNTIKKEAGHIGADAVILTKRSVDILAFNTATRTEGSIHVWNNGAYFQSTTRSVPMFIVTHTRHGYAIKWKDRQ